MEYFRNLGLLHLARNIAFPQSVALSLSVVIMVNRSIMCSFTYKYL